MNDGTFADTGIVFSDGEGFVRLGDVVVFRVAFFDNTRYGFSPSISFKLSKSPKVSSMESLVVVPLPPPLSLLLVDESLFPQEKRGVAKRATLRINMGFRMFFIILSTSRGYASKEATKVTNLLLKTIDSKRKGYR